MYGQGAAQRAPYGAVNNQDIVYANPTTAGMQTQKSYFVPGQRRRLNVVAIVIALFVPWAIFTVAFTTMSFSLRYTQPGLVLFVMIVLFIMVVVFGACAFDAARKKAKGVVGREPTWFIFLFITSLLAWGLGVAGGNSNYSVNMDVFYSFNNLNTYSAVDPQTTRGQQLMDAGRVLFVEGSRLDVSKSIGFKSKETYCVAPVTRGNSDLVLYDFWAVGKDCCSGNKPDYHCGHFNSPGAIAGLRLMEDSDRAYYRLAVQQAEAVYGIKADHPLFFEWLEDPIAQINSYQEAGFKYFLLGVLTYFSFQLFLVVVAAIAFSKMGFF
mmetsp:Transcript_10885/g.24731  ORF Transcript_10885/g.24731 Transcript_10885/m.24731 type:complete len:324 (+) Transcript_10885:109-1080(+)